ncbi:universal stress protein [Streptomyces sp. N2-109]|uniref:Universal stress protein n=1 Tax=Streptomyces gossypii TaxID=2883101 RepID=A0ABT2JQF1_9ACTN|nr:universal stress protein [Streptomyces gossypii]MCT2589976.1 universal stress protein [Streptomyces gossypii]
MTGTPRPPAEARPIVVGTDGSPHADKAVLFALREAQLRGVGLRAVCAYFYTPDRYTTYGWMTVPDPEGSLYTQLRDNALAEAHESVTRLKERIGGPTVDVEIMAEPGRPAEVLLDVSRDAGLLVVGSRGSGMWGRLTLGSTSTEVVHHAHLPVVVVPADSEVASG